MKKRTKVVIGIGISLLILVLGGLGFAGNYFYTLAIDAHSDKSVVFGNEEEDPKAAQASKDSYNEMMARDTKDVWMKNKDGYRLHAYEINQTGNKWVIVVHGYISEAKTWQRSQTILRNRDIVYWCLIFALTDKVKAIP